MNEDTTKIETPTTGQTKAGGKPNAKVRPLNPLRRKPKGAEQRNSGRRRGRKAYPVMTFEEAMTIGRGIMEHGAGHPMKRVTLLEKLKLADNQPTRNLITTSGKYGVTQGGYQAEEIKLTETGRYAVDSKSSPRQKAQALFDLAIKGVEPFMALYARYKGGKVPAPEVMRDALEDLDKGDRAPCVDIFVSNAKTVGILKTVEGAQHLLSIESLLDELPAQGRSTTEPGQPAGQTSGAVNGEVLTTGQVDFETVCFFIAPIGGDDSEERKHSDAILASFVEPALTGQNLNVVRADKITKPGMISGQVIEHILKSKLVIVDMSFQNPNVFYELCLRHVTGKPTVHIIREGDEIPFDVQNFRTVTIKMDTIYNVLAHLETHRAEIAQKVREAVAGGVSTNNPILTFCPTAKFVLE